jgi:hypothetical protein
MADSTQSQNPHSCNPIELAWSAGFFDGEGNMRWRENKEYRSQRSRAYGTFTLQIGQIDRAVLERFMAAVGCGKINGPYVRKNGSHKDTTYYQFSAHGLTGIEAFHKIRPYLSSIKRDQGDCAERKYREQVARPRLGNGHLRKKELSALASTT